MKKKVIYRIKKPTRYLHIRESKERGQIALALLVTITTLTYSPVDQDSRVYQDYQGGHELELGFPEFVLEYEHSGNAADAAHHHQKHQGGFSDAPPICHRHKLVVSPDDEAYSIRDTKENQHRKFISTPLLG